VRGGRGDPALYYAVRQALYCDSEPVGAFAAVADIRARLGELAGV
jgi:hypothetical protein